MSLPPLQISCDTQWDRRTSGTSGRARLAGYVRLFAYKVLTVLRYYISSLLHLLLFSLRDCPTHIKYVFPKHFCSPCYGFRLFRKLSSEISCRSSSLSALSHTRKARSVHIHIPELAKIVRMCRFSPKTASGLPVMAVSCLSFANVLRNTESYELRSHVVSKVENRQHVYRFRRKYVSVESMECGCVLRDLWLVLRDLNRGSVTKPSFTVTS
jgi:hypothetical protein